MFLNYFEDHYTKTRFLYFKLFFYHYCLIDVSFKLKFSNVDHQTNRNIEIRVFKYVLAFFNLLE